MGLSGLVSLAFSAGSVGTDVPVDPDAPTARKLLIDELSKSSYRAAEPTWFDRLSKAFFDWLDSLKITGNSATQGPLLLIAVIVVIGVVVAAYLLFGPPRLGRRSSVTGVLFGEQDERDAATIRSAAEAAAAREDWVTAIAEMFRSIARGLAERTIVVVTPGTTAHDFAGRAGAALPSFADRLAAAASAFDEVRYLDGTGSGEKYRAAADLEREVRAARPHLAPVAVPA